MTNLRWPRPKETARLGLDAKDVGWVTPNTFSAFCNNPTVCQAGLHVATAILNDSKLGARKPKFQGVHTLYLSATILADFVFRVDFLKYFSLNACLVLMKNDIIALTRTLCALRQAHPQVPLSDERGLLALFFFLSYFFRRRCRHHRRVEVHWKCTPL